MIKILFFTPTSAYTGSEIVLYNIINNINDSRIKPLSWISKFNGELIDKLHKNIKCITFEKQLKNPCFLLNFILSLMFNPCAHIKSLNALKAVFFKSFLSYIHGSIKADVWYINTILQQDVLEYAYLNQIPCVVHVHELEQMLLGLTDQQVEILIHYPRLIIACSKTCAQMLKILGRTENIEVCYPTINTKKISQFKFSSINMRKKMGISKSTFIWCMSGSADSNKNPVRFVEIAYQLLERNYDCHFLWLGNNLHSGLSVFAKKYAKSLNIDNKITWTGILKDSNYYEHLNLADGFVLTSSRESFSIVSLEALYFKKPIVSFNCGGIREIVNDKLGYVIDSWNISDLVEVMIKVMINNSLFDPNLAKVTSEKYAIEIQIDKWEKIMTSYFV